MKCAKYYVGLDIGTDSVGYAVTDTDHELCKHNGDAMWGVTLFDEAQTAAGRRAFRTARRRLDRRQQRVRLTMDLFAEEIHRVDPSFFTRIKESYLYPETDDDKIRLFDTYEAQREYDRKYPTIHHLITELMSSTEPHDVRVVYLASAWLVAHRGHFLTEVDKSNVAAVTDFGTVYDELESFIVRDGEYSVPWQGTADMDEVETALKGRSGVTKKVKALTEALFGTQKAPKLINEEYEYNYELVIKLLCGGKVGLKELFGKEEYSELEEKSVALNADDEKLAAVMQSIGDDAALISVLKAVYDWSVLVDMLKGKQTVSEAKVEIYRQHKNDLETLKYFTKKYIPEKYSEIFRSPTAKDNYVAYIGKSKVSNNTVKVKKSANREDFCKYILSVFKSVTPSTEDAEKYDRMISRLEASDFMPKQVDGDNRVIPYQLYWYELNKIIGNAKAYLPFLNDADENGITVSQKLLSVFEFKVPYYVGPLREKSDPRFNHWMIRKAEGRIYPWNFEDMVDLDASEDAFIRRLTNSCTYLPDEDVLPKFSMVYSSFEVLNEINNIKINGNAIPVDVKQAIYNDVFMNHHKVTPKRIRDYLISNNIICDSDVISGLDITVKSSLKPYIEFRNLINGGVLSHADAERIINRAAYSEDRTRLSAWLQKEYPQLSEKDRKYISGLKYKNFGRLSKKLLCGIGGLNKETGEVYSSVIRAMWETNCNLMQLLSDRFTFTEQIEAAVKEYYGVRTGSISERLDEMCVSNAVKRPIIRAFDILGDIVKVQGRAPERIFIEMARGTVEDQKGVRTKSRYEQIIELYKKIKDEDIRLLTKEFEELGDTVHNRLQSDKLFLYFIQLGRCLYTGNPIDIRSVISGDGRYNIEHIYPRSFVKDDSILNNEILVESEVNSDKSDSFPVKPDVQQRMRGYWERLNKLNLISDEKFKRLTRTVPFTNEERFEFINRQLVETRQSTKAVAALLKELYPETEVVYVKAGLVSDFRHQFNLPKSRTVNDLHHAKDAYLNIVVGDVWYSKFSRQFWRTDGKNNAKVEVVFASPVICNGKTVWRGASDTNRVIKTVNKNSAHMTMYSYCKHSGQSGGFFDQNPLPAAKDLIPLKKGRPTELYGGYNGATITGFVLAKYKEASKIEVSLVPLKLLNMAEFTADDSYAAQYVANEFGGKASEIEILLGKRIIKVYTMLSLDGALYCVRGKGSTTTIGLMNMMPFMTSPENEAYIKKLERFTEKRKNSENLIYDREHDGISAEDNAALYELYIKKLTNWPYNTRPACNTLVNKLLIHTDDFERLDIFKQAYVLLQIQGIMGRMKQADLKYLNESASSGTTRMSLNLSNWKKNYTDVRIIDRSASGLFEKASENLLELL